jgi:hypothetical protein
MTIAQDFESFMNQVWSDESDPLEDGGVAIRHKDPDLYDEWHNANETARVKFNAQTIRIQTTRDGMPGAIRTFDDGSRIFISKDGGMIQECRHPTRAKQTSGAKQASLA